jgi:hypothetical protein
MPAMASHEPRTLTPMWLAHHYPESYDRCVAIGSRHICRRCIVLYPLAFVVMTISLVWGWPGDTDGMVLVLLPIPAVVEFVLEHLDIVRYHSARQVVFTVPLAIALGRGFAIYVEDPTSRLFWGVVLAYGCICLAAVVWRVRRFRSTP